MKEHKFRIWEPLNKRLHLVDFSLYKYQNHSSHSHLFILPEGKQSLMNPYTVMNLNAVIVMQYTGLKVNNKELYESDLIVEECGEQKNVWVVKWNKEMACFYLENQQTKENAYLSDLLKVIQNKNSKIMGNIYEDSELLAA